MRSALIAALVLGVSCSSADDKWSEFKKAFSKVYESLAEEERRLAIFTENLGHIVKYQALDPLATYSHLSPMADWTVEEFAARNNLMAEMFVAPKAVDMVQDVSGLPSDFDWRKHGAVNPVKNQQQCGSCWAFATVANIEGANFLKTKTLLSLSEQELVDCDKKTGDQGCNGGLPTNAFQDMVQNGLGVELESKYPYTAQDGKCTARAADERVFISNYTTISTDEDQIAAALMKYGPLAIGINAGVMQFYSHGISNPWRIFCNPKKLDHGVAIVGFGVDGGKKYWTIRNSWGASWGEQGYYRIIRGKGACGLNSMVSTAIMGSSSTSSLIV